LFLAVVRDVYKDFFCQAAIEAVIADHRIKLLVFDPDQMEVVQWID